MEEDISSDLYCYLVRFIFASFFMHLFTVCIQQMLNFSSLMCLRTRHISQNSFFVHLQVYRWENRLYPLLLTLKKKRQLDIIRKWQRSSINLQFFTICRLFIYLLIFEIDIIKQLFQASQQLIYPFFSLKTHTGVTVQHQEWIFFCSSETFKPHSNSHHE